ncbi:MAG: class I SAM-dependent methyltransferase [bacterium]|nr:class I SAM-dependent methyltransferase [bacterium]
MSIKVHPDWWKTLFDDIYLKTDARTVCNEELSRREVDIILDLLPVESGHHIADLCGGQGRHSLELARRGRGECTVVDYSPHLVEVGRSSARHLNLPVVFVQGDARETGLPGDRFDYVLILGNSLGYLPHDDDDGRIMAEAWRLLQPGGHLLVDVADGDRVLEQMAPNTWHEVDDDLVVCRQREIGDGRVKAREIIFSRRKGLVRDQSYAIRIYRPGQLKKLVVDAGFVEAVIHNDFCSHTGSEDLGFMNMRTIVTARKPAAVVKQ